MYTYSYVRTRNYHTHTHTYTRVYSEKFVMPGRDNGRVQCARVPVQAAINSESKDENQPTYR